MTEQKKDSSRSKLTLKLKPAGENTLSLKKGFEEKIESKKGSIQVTIKGRRATSAQSSPALDEKELHSKQKILQNAANYEAKDFDTNAILSKINKEKLSLKAKKAEIEKQVEDAKEEKREERVEEVVPPVRRVENQHYNVDNFDVRNKIKQSLEVHNRQKEERDKLVEERRKKAEEERKKLETEKVERARIEKEKKAKIAKKPTKAFSEEDDFDKKIGKNFKERKGTKKLTYIIGDEDEGGFYRKKKKHRDLQENSQKEYQKVSREVTLPELISVADLAARMSEKTGDVVKKLFSMGVVATSNQVIDADTAELIISEFGHTVKRVTQSDVENILTEIDEDNAEKLDRAPVVTIMGHVDHGKTSLLDAIRTTDVVQGEHGGITQHIGASRVKTVSGKYITFLDTPGHEAFTEMRSRGANITDIVVLVVAADDGVKAQTIEAIHHAKAAGVPIVVAVNKIDKPGADPSRVKNELLSHDIVAEDLGGEVMFIEVSAKQKLNLDKLEEAILLQAEVLDLKAPYNTKAQGVVLESRIDPAKGVVATVLVQKGTLNISDIIVAGTSYGRIRKMADDKGKNLKSLTPSMSAEILGLDSAPNAGDQFFFVDEEKHARDIIAYRTKKEREAKAMRNSAKSIDQIFKDSGKEGLKYLNIVIKGDVNGSVEAIVGSLTKLNTEEVAIKVIHSATGGITETDIALADVSNAIILGFNVRANNNAKETAKLKAVEIRYYSIIYNIVDDIKALLSGMLNPSQNEEYLGQAEIRQVFKVSGTNVKVAGSSVSDGVIKRGAKVRLLRDNVVIFDGVLKTLKRFKDDVKEVKSGFECGFSLENYDDIKEGDIIECYQIVEKKREL